MVAWCCANSNNVSHLLVHLVGGDLVSDVGESSIHSSFGVVHLVCIAGLMLEDLD
jgi:hypothetical protein